MTVLQVRWLPLLVLGDDTKGKAVALTMMCAHRRDLLKAWANVMRANILPPEFPTGEIREVRQLGAVVIFEPRILLAREDAEARWPELAEWVADRVTSQRASLVPSSLG